MFLNDQVYNKFKGITICYRHIATSAWRCLHSILACLRSSLNAHLALTRCVNVGQKQNTNDHTLPYQLRACTLPCVSLVFAIALPCFAPWTCRPVLPLSSLICSLAYHASFPLVLFLWRIILLHHPSCSSSRSAAVVHGPLCLAIVAASCPPRLAAGTASRRFAVLPSRLVTGKDAITWFTARSYVSSTVHSHARLVRGLCSARGLFWRLVRGFFSCLVRGLFERLIHGLFLRLVRSVSPTVCSRALVRSWSLAYSRLFTL